MASRTIRGARKRRKDTARFVAFSCIHAPEHDQDAIDWLCTVIEEHKPDVLISLGDDLEADGASRWPSEAPYKLIDEYEADDRVKAQIASACPSAERIRLMGNHCDNIIGMGRINPKIRELCDWRIPQFTHKGVQVNKNALKWKVSSSYDFCRRRGVYRLGQVTFGHGWQTNMNAGRDQSVLLGTPYGLFVSGHTHAPEAVTQARMTGKVPLPYWYANAGTLRNLDPDYMRRNNGFHWGQACVVGEADLRAGPSKSPRMSRHWVAETKVKDMYSEWVDRRGGR